MEQPLPPYGSCLLGSVNITKFVTDPFGESPGFNYDKYAKVIRIFSRMLDNVVEINGLPLEQQRHEILTKRRHGMGILGLGSALAMLKIKYGSKESLEFTEKVCKALAIESIAEGIELAKEKGPAPLLEDSANRANWLASKYLANIWEDRPDLKIEAFKYGCRYTHATSIAPTGTISLSLNNNASNGIEPSFSHMYYRNVIVEGKKSKVQSAVYSYEYLLYKHMYGDSEVLPEYFVTSQDIPIKAHVDIQAAAQKWIDSSISKTINVPTECSFEEFKEIYMYAHEKGLKGCTTFRFNPAVFQGVLVTEKDLDATLYQFTTSTGDVIEARGNEQIEYDGEIHSAANLYDALKEGYYGKF